MGTERNRSMSEHRQFSTGRGGAGNMASPPNTGPPPTAEDLITPTIKADVYTTGRGGSGNMVSNDDPELARVRQDVEVPPPVTRGRGDAGRFHTGRGGAANVYTPSEEGDDAEKALSRQETNQSQSQEKNEGSNQSHSHSHNPIKDALHRTLSVVSEKKEELEEKK